MDLEGKTVLITGASRGLGRALAERLATEPVRVLCGVRDPQAFAPLAGEHRVVALDLGSRESIDAGIAGLGEDAARIDVLVNNAGQFVGGLLENQSLDDVYDDEVLHTGGGSRIVELLGQAPSKVMDAVAKRAINR